MGPTATAQTATTPSVHELAAWREKLLRERHDGVDGINDCCAAFPYSSVLETFHTFGKEYVPGAYIEYLDELEREIRALEPGGDSWAYDMLCGFFCGLLDKHRKQYCYDSYIGSSIIEQVMSCPSMTFEDAWRERTRQIVALVADVVHFECLTYLGEMPRQSVHLVPKRLGCKRIRGGVHALKTFGAAVPELLHESGLDSLSTIWKTTEEGDEDLLRQTARMAKIIIDRVPEETRQMIALTMLPVSTDHDEYMFIRVVQAFEMMFVMLASGFRETIHRLTENRMPAALDAIQAMTDTLHTSLSFFRVLNTMPSENFHEFRDLTDGASAIQSRQYKWVEVLAAHPTPKRIESEGFEPVPAVKAAYRQGLRNVEDAFEDCRQHLPPETLEQCRTALLALDKQFVAWKRSHVNVVIRALGNVKGTGGTAGLVYLQRYSTTRLFPFLYRQDKQPPRHAVAS